MPELEPTIFEDQNTLLSLLDSYPRPHNANTPNQNNCNTDSIKKKTKYSHIICRISKKLFILIN